MFLAIAAIVFGGLFWATGDASRTAYITVLLMLGLAALVPIIVLVLCLVFGIVVGIHELGHYLAGRLVGFDFRVAVVGPLGLRAERDRVAAFRMRPAWPGGFVSMLPPNDHNIVPRYRAFILGGPIASVLLLGLILGLWRLSGLPMALTTTAEERRGGSELLLSAFQLLTLPAASIVVSTLFPHRAHSGMSSDGLQLIELARNSVGFRRRLALMDLQRLLAAGVKGEALPRETIEAACQPHDESPSELFALGIRWAYEINHDRAASETTARRHGELAEKLTKTLGPEWRSSAMLIQATQAIFVRQDAEEGARYLSLANVSTPSIEATRATLEAALAAPRHDPALQERILRARAAIDAVSAKSNVSWDWERAWLDRLEAESRSA